LGNEERQPPPAPTDQTDLIYEQQETKTRTHLDRQGESAKLEPRILLEDPAKSYHAKHRVASADLFDNRLIFGDNLLALKALEGEFSGKVKCVFIDPLQHRQRL
jgi:hypothetical protein